MANKIKLARYEEIIKQVINNALNYEINNKIAKPSTDVKEGDIIEITFANRKLKARIINIAEHVRKENAKEMYEILEGVEDQE